MVVILPDGGRQYLGKLYNDDWMRESQFIEAEIRLTVADILRSKRIKQLEYAETSENALAAMKKMRAIDSSQLPVFEEGSVVGTVYDDDLINAILQAKDLASMTVRELMRESLPIIQREATLEEITRFIPGKCPALLVDLGNGQYQILTKFDLVTAVGTFAEGKR